MAKKAATKKARPKAPKPPVEEAAPPPHPKPEPALVLEDLPSFAPPSQMLIRDGDENSGLRPLGVTPTRIASIDFDALPALGELEPVESAGANILKQLSDLALSGSVSPSEVSRLATFVEAFQTRVDIAIIGGMAANIDRVSDVSSKIAMIEARIMEMLPTLPVDFALNFLKVLQKDRIACTTALATRSNTPTISSPSNMSGSLMNSGKQAEEEQQTALGVTISADGRKRVASIFQQIRHKIITAETTKVEP